MHKNNISKFLRWGFGVLGFLFLMYLCASAGYHYVRKNAPSQVSDGAHNKPNTEEGTKPFPNLPVGLSGTYSEEENLVTDLNDYLVLSEGNLVNLYIIDTDGDKVFEKVLDIDLSALKEEDRQLLKQGIILGTKEALLSLIEDYSS